MQKLGANIFKKIFRKKLILIESSLKLCCLQFTISTSSPTFLNQLNLMTAVQISKYLS